MPKDAERFRVLATDCRNLAKGERTEVDKARLEEIADELDAEADKMEAEEGEG